MFRISMIVLALMAASMLATEAQAGCFGHGTAAVAVVKANNVHYGQAIFANGYYGRNGQAVFANGHYGRNVLRARFLNGRLVLPFVLNGGHCGNGAAFLGVQKVRSAGCFGY